jgi:hypothetical protein
MGFPRVPDSLDFSHFLEFPVGSKGSSWGNCATSGIQDTIVCVMSTVSPSHLPYLMAAAGNPGLQLPPHVSAHTSLPPCSL